MKIGIFDSGLGGLFVLRNMLRNKSTKQYDYIFLADTKNLPYGNKTQDQIYKLTVKAVEYLFKQDCALVIVACNTASSEALRRIQQSWLPKSKFRDRKVLGVIRPTVEMVANSTGMVGIIGTTRTIESKAYIRELKNVNSKLRVKQLATPLLVPMIEAGNLGKIDEVLNHYLESFKVDQIKTLILACTHYCVLHGRVQKLLGKGTRVVSQDQLLPGKLKKYLIKHKQLDKKLSKNGKLKLLLTKRVNNKLYAEFKNWTLI